MNSAAAVQARLKDAGRLRILFVCLGNICRSPAAQAVMQVVAARGGEAARWQTDSCGLGDWHIGDLPDHRMRVHARQRGYELTHRARQIREADFDDYDLIVAMDGGNERRLRSLAPTPEAETKVVQMMAFAPDAAYDHVPDPYYEGSEGFELVLDLLEAACANLFLLLKRD